MLEAGAHALGCAVIPGGVGNTEQQIEAIAQLKPGGLYRHAGFPEDPARYRAEGRQGRLLASSAASSRARRCRRRCGRSSPARGVEVLQCYATAEAGVIAYETPAREGMVVNENLIVEIVRPGTGDPVAEGEVGEVVVTVVQSRLSDDPARDRRSLGACCRARSPCGRTNMRIKGWMGRADQTTKVKGMFVHPEQIAEVAQAPSRASAACGLWSTRDGEQDAMTLHGRMRRAGRRPCATRSPRPCSR